MNSTLSDRNILSQVRDIFFSETCQYILKRTLQAILTLLLASILCFAIIQLSPGNFLDTLKQNPKITPQRIEELTRQFGLSEKKDFPTLVEQYTRWLRRALRGDLGLSMLYFQPVTLLIGQRIRATLELAIASIILTWAIAIPLGIIGAVNQNKFIDKFLRVLSYTAQGFPSFVTALSLLIVAQICSPLLPVGGRTSINHQELSPIGQLLDISWHMILPTIALTITGFAGLQRITRGELLDVLRQDYIQTARAKGLPENRVIYVHALRNAINPLVTLLGFEFASLLSGAFIAEFFFNWPGLGKLILVAVTGKDLYLVMGSLMIGAIMLIIGNLFADLLLKFVDPRIKLADLK
ncbi:ABC transporter permease [Chamaesiphon polymorphus]|uniref:ABC transporter substrate-binding protein n=1 Tax=Chamaesiphon polymorphus CCALA 037 TaxID=2107692 RepID=A0A2T1G5F8_9CYAN|nr:ABC transporter permease [Chamaesiphon polymorphus]PSB52472.1 ABC transporter substrate-binding protein [Chamaesiphon polymorphus CCALA 037]